jgi:gliding motility-associated-like protein
MEVFFDDITIYDGPTTASPVLAGPIEGDLTGLQFIATNPSGCLTMLVSSDGSVSCTSGSFGPIEYTVGCTQGGPQYVWEWTPSEGLSDPTIPNPDVVSLNGQTTYTLATYPVGHPDCVSYDDVEVFPAFDFNITSQDPSCYGNDGVISVTIDGATGTPPWTVEFYENGALQSNQLSNGGLTSFQDLFPNDYSLHVSDQFGCLYVNDIVINSPPALVFTLSNDTTICVDGAALLQTASLMDNDNSWGYTWSGGLGFGNAVYAGPIETTTYTVFATDDAGCDSEPMEVTVTVRDSLSVQISGTPLICGGALATLQVDDSQGGLAPYSYSWSFNGNSIDTGENIDNQQFISGTYCAFISDACETPIVSNCFDVVVETPIDVQFAADTTRGCFPAPINFEILVDPALFSFSQWNFGDGSFGIVPAPAHLFENPGFYDIELTLTSPIGCVYSNEYNNYITVYDNPTAGFTATPQPTTMPDTEISFFDYSLGSVIDWYWVFDTLNYQGTSTLQDPVFKFPISQGGYYPVTLVVTDANGCKDQVTRWVEINDILNIFVPNAFTPNNDGVNDIFFVTGTDIDPDRFEIRVFDRWGAKVYESTDPTEIWDGSVNNGAYYTPNDVYIWQIDLYSLSTAERKELTGTVILLR